MTMDSRPNGDIEQEGPADQKTIAYIHFLVNPLALKEHLEKSNPEPTAVDLLTLFLKHSLNPLGRLKEKPGDVVDVFEHPSQYGISEKKVAGLWLLSLKAAALIRWDLNILEKMQIPLQEKLMEELIQVSFSRSRALNDPVDLSSLLTMRPCQRGALFLFHRWVLRTIRLNRVPKEPTKVPLVNLFYGLDGSPPNHDFDEGLEVSHEELSSEINHELGMFFAFCEDFQQAAYHFEQTLNILSKIPPSTKISPLIDRGALTSFARILGVDGAEAMDKHGPKRVCSSVQDRFREALATGDESAVDLLELDMMEDSLCFLDRFWVETVESTAFFPSAQRRIRVANAIHVIVSGGILHNHRRISPDEWTDIGNLLQSFLPRMSPSQKRNVTSFLSCSPVLLPLASDPHPSTVGAAGIEVVSPPTHHHNPLLPSLMPKELLRTLDLSMSPSPHGTNKKEIVQSPSENKKLSSAFMRKFIGTSPPVASPDKKKNMKDSRPAGEMCSLADDIISCYDLSKLATLVGELAKPSMPPDPVIFLCAQWELPLPLGEMLRVVPKGPVPDYILLMLVKARELQLLKRHQDAWVFLNHTFQMLEEQKNKAAIPTAPVLQRIVTWELHFNQLLEGQIALRKGKSDWNAVARLRGMNAHLEVPCTLAHLCLDLQEGSSPRAKANLLWDLLVVVFRSGVGSRSVAFSRGERGGPSPTTPTAFIAFVRNILNVDVLSVLLAFSARVFNILRGEPQGDVVTPHLNIWPSSVHNPSQLSLTVAQEVLATILDHCLSLAPFHVPWLRAHADLCLVLERYAQAFRGYLLCGMVSTSGFLRVDFPFDSETVRRMIRCNCGMECFTQAAVLCQFLDKVDYSQAFQCLMERPAVDGMDSLYGYFYDTSCLEFLVFFLNQEREAKRRDEVIKILGRLELNANNAEEIRREVRRTRTAQFFREMAGLYI
ncbi:unnamed protein product [Cyprideis torosa]|uniref:INTS8 TPR repeats domain-containing protein n=1 Tax=Cyprideis torosa TaxID=163714 RepID=A0A7R8W8X9_9CRUS|nr:unnamed protein product [Cyprideis torosa]CAG0886730.1 unnamed protein product [Cyprideis torosa]